ncbi:MAG: hypothetical protein LLF28_07985 [Nitrospiraceae bacterium]|nr:hypothetical protein [Nitrospiraceae bacterium]
MDLTCDSEFGKFSTDEFLTEKYKTKFGDGLSGIGIKAFIKKNPYNCTLDIGPHLQDKMQAVASANFHFEIPYDINFENEFSMRYNEFEEYVNGIFS